MNSELISVVVPFVNHITFIERCANNVLNQSYPLVELIFVNNGSTDGSDEVVQRIIDRYPHMVRLVNEKKSGIPFARNRGLKEATGEFVSFLDVDDLFTTDKLERLYHLLKRFPEAAMAYGQTLRIYTGTGKKVIQDSGIVKSGINYPPDLVMDWTKSFYRLPQTGATLTRTFIARDVGGFPENLVLGNDDVGYHIAISIKYPVAFEPFVAVEYFRHETSEGARLNNVSSVYLRYFDAHLKVTEPRGKIYYKSAGDIRLWGQAQKNLFLNYVQRLPRGVKNDFRKEMSERLFLFYRLMLPLYQVLPFPIAHFKYKLIRRIVYLFNPLKYPLN